MTKPFSLQISYSIKLNAFNCCSDCIFLTIFPSPFLAGGLKLIHFRGDCFELGRIQPSSYVCGVDGGIILKGIKKYRMWGYELDSADSGSAHWGALVNTVTNLLVS